MIGLDGGAPRSTPRSRATGARSSSTAASSPSRAGPLHGLAVDVGTTTVAVRLYDLETGALVATSSFENPQRFGGTDIMARIRYDGEHKGSCCSARCSAISATPSRRCPCDPLTIYELVAAGNPTMRDLFFGLDVGTDRPDAVPLGDGGGLPRRPRADHQPVRDRAAPAPARSIPRRGSTACRSSARHVGADAAACVLATGLFESDRRRPCSTSAPTPK